MSNRRKKIDREEEARFDAAWARQRQAAVTENEDPTTTAASPPGKASDRYEAHTQSE